MLQFIIPALLKAAAVYQAAKTAGTVIDYATTDQEKEGRELGAATAAKVYAPALEDLQKQKNKIIAEEKNAQSNFATQAKFLTEQCAHYERETANYKRKIETIRREHGNDPGVKAVLVALAASASGGGAAIGAGAVLSGNFVRAFSSSVATSALSWLALPAAVVTYVLESEMNDKRERFFKEEFEKQALVWQEKIKSCRAEISERIKSLKFLKHNNTYKIKELKAEVDDALQEYCGAMSDYKMLNLVVKQQ